MTKTGNFRKYFFYKLGQNKQFIFIFALLNFFMAIVPQILLYSYGNFGGLYFSGGIMLVQDFSQDSQFIMVLSAIISMVVITFMTVRSMRIYHDRSAMDTLGCLPLSYGERFWGDLLSGVCANYISLIPLFGVSLIMENVIRNMVEKSMKAYGITSAVIKTYAVPTILTVIMISYLGVYAITAFISSCSGKFSSAVVFSLLAMVLIPGVYTVYAKFIYSYGIGIDPYMEISSTVNMMPPFGFIFSLWMRRIDQLLSYTEKDNMDYLINRPACFIVPILIAAVFLAGAYFIGKKRKAEKTGEGFVFNSVFYALLMSLLILVVGLTASSDYFFGEKKTIGLFVILPISFLFYSALEFSQNKSLKGFWKTVVRFAAVFGAGVAFLALVRATDAFNGYKKLPGENSVKEIRISGEYFFSQYYGTTEHIYRADDSVSAIVSEHKKLLETDDLETGHMLNITYVTKSGREIYRGYAEPYDDSNIKSFSTTVNGLREFDPSVLGVIGGTDFTGITVEYNDYKDFNVPRAVIRSDKVAELAEILRRDIENYYFDDNDTGKSTVGDLMFYDGNDRYGKLFSQYRILYLYEDTLKFLNDPANYVNLVDEMSANSYNIFYYTDNSEGILSNFSVTVSEDDASEFAKELLSYIEFDPDKIDNSQPGFLISDNNNIHGYSISPENEKAALKAMLGLFREKNVE